MFSDRGKQFERWSRHGHLGLAAVWLGSGLGVVIGASPEITTQPQSRTNEAGSVAVFTAAAFGAEPLTYRWRRDGLAMAENGRIVGAMSNTLTIAGVRLSDARRYALEVSNAEGGVDSEVVTLTVTAPDVVKIQDGNLEAAIRSTINKPTGPLSPSDLAGITSLFACRRGIGNLVGLEWATNLSSLHLSGNFVTDLSPLDSLSRLVQLSLDHNQIGDLSGLASLPNLADLNAGENQITNAAALVGLTNLSRLRLDRNAIDDLSFVSSLAALVSVEVEENLITDLTPLMVRSNLGSVAVGGNPIVDLSPLSGLWTLTNLSLRNLGLERLSSLEALTQLRSLNLEGNRIQDLSPLAGLVDLNALNLCWNKVTNANVVLPGITNLAVLYLRGIAISNIAFLNQLGRLRFLNLSENAIRDLAPLAGLTNLDYLALSGNSITDYSVLTNLSRLVNLELRGNAISNLNFISALSGLRYVDLGYNQINELTNLVTLTNLHSVVLDGNRFLDSGTLSQAGGVSNLWLNGTSLDNVDFLTNLTQLTCLSLDDNSIADFSPIGALTNLDNLHLAGNAISNASFIQDLTRLTTLGLRHNRLGDVEELVGLTNLLSLDLRQNRLIEVGPLTNLLHLAFVDLRVNRLETGTNLVLSSLRARGADVLSEPQDQPPSIVVNSNWIVAANAASSRTFSVVDDFTRGDQLIVQASSANLELLPDQSITVAVAENLVTLTIIPASNQIGTVTLNLAVSDNAGWLTAAGIFLTVQYATNVAVPDPNLETILRQVLGKPTGELNSVDLLDLTELYLGDPTISSLSGLEWATNLTTLFLVGNAITDLAALQNLPRLNDLGLSGILLSDYSSLAGFTNLTTLTLSGNVISNLSFLHGLSQLTDLIVKDTAVTDWSPITGMTNLTSLRLDGNSISNLGFLENLTQLTGLALANARLTEIFPLAALTNLVFLDLRQNRLTEVITLANLSKLTLVDLRQNLLETDTNSVLTSMRAQGVSVRDRPQRQPPVISALDRWFVAADTTSYIHFKVWNDGPPDEPVTITFSSSTESPLSKTNLVINRDLAGQAQDWILTVLPPPNYSGTGTITLTVSNAVGLSASTTVELSIALSLPLNAHVLEATNFTSVTNGATPWFGQVNTSYDGISAAQSGSIRDNDESWLGATFNGPGLLSFWWKISSEPHSDWLEFFLDDLLQDHRISGEVDWELVEATVPPGPHTLKWRYFKDLGWTLGLDAAWLDQVSFVPLSWLELVGIPTNGQCQLLLHPVPGKQYLLETSTNLSDWLILTAVVTANPTMPFLDSTASDATRFYRLQELFASSIWLQHSTRVGNEFRMELHSPPGLRFEIQVSPDLASWSGLFVLTNILGTTQYTDLQSTNSGSRFYRARLLP